MVKRELRVCKHQTNIAKKIDATKASPIAIVVDGVVCFKRRIMKSQTKRLNTIL